MVEKKSTEKQSTETAEKPKKAEQVIKKEQKQSVSIEKKESKKVEAVSKNAKKKIEESFERYAIFKIGGKQYQAIEGKTIAIEKIEGEPGDKIEFKEVLFRKSGDGKFEIGRPLVEAAVLKASIVKHDKAPKVVVFKFKRRKKSRVKKGHRQPLTVIRIEAI